MLAGLSASPMLLLLLVLLTPQPVTPLITYGNETWDIFNMGKHISDFNLTSTIMTVQFKPNANCEIITTNAAKTSWTDPTSSNDGASPLIILAIWAQATQAGCALYGQVSTQVEKYYTQAELLIFSSSYEWTGDYSFYYQASEPIGTVLDPPYLINFSIVSNETAYELAALPSGTVITAVSYNTESTLFFLSPAWLSMRWIIFSCYLILTGYSGYQMIIEFKRVFRIRIKNWAFLSCFLTCLLKTIEYAFDPCGSTYMLTYIGWNVIYWLAFFFLYETVAAIITTWIFIVSSNEMLPKFVRVSLQRFLYFSMVFFALLFALTIVFDLLSFPGDGIAYDLCFVLILIFLLAQFGVAAFACIRVLQILKNFSQVSLGRKMIINKVTKATLFLIGCFLGVLATLIGYLVITILASLYTTRAYLAVFWILNCSILTGLCGALYFFSVPTSGSKHTTEKYPRGKESAGTPDLSSPRGNNLNSSFDTKSKKQVIGHDFELERDFSKPAETEEVQSH